MTTSLTNTFPAIALLLATASADQKHDPLSGITVTSAAWSNAPARWTIYPDGSIDDARGVQAFVAGPPIDMVARHSDGGPGRYARIARLLAPARRKAGAKIGCTDIWSDNFYGQVTWADGARLDYYFGCAGAANRPIVDSIKAAQAQIKAWIAQAPIVRRYRTNSVSKVDQT